MGIPVRVSGAWAESSAQYVRVSGEWKPCKNVYVRQGGKWLSVYANTMTVTGSGTKSLSNVRVGTIITFSGTVTNNVYDSGDYYGISASGAEYVSGSTRWGPNGGAYSCQFTATSSTPSISIVNDGMSSISATISYFYEKEA